MVVRRKNFQVKINDGYFVMETKKEKIKKYNKYSKFERMSFPFVATLVIFPVLQFIVFWGFVNIQSIMLTFQDATGSFTLQNLKDVMQAFSGLDKFGFNIWESLRRSMTIWSISTFITFPIGIVTTYILYKRLPGHYVFRICYIIPGLMGSIMWTTLIRYMVSEEGPVFMVISNITSLPEETLRNGLFGSEATAFPTLCWITFIFGLVGNNAVLTGAFSRVPDELYESAELDGAGFWRICFQVAIPCIWSTITMLLTFNLCGIFTADANVFLYSNGTGEPGMSTIGFLLYNMTYQISLSGGTASSYGYPAAVGFVLTLMTLPIVLIGRKVLNKIQDNVEV